MKRKFFRCLFFFACFFVCAAAISCANGAKYQFSEYQYTNPEKGLPDKTDTEVTLNGDLSDSAWQGKRWMTTYLPNLPSVTLEMTAHIGKEGVYFAFKVQDSPIFAVPSRFACDNSSIELYVSTPDGASGVHNATAAFELDLDAAGQMRSAKHVKAWDSEGNLTSKFVNWPVEYYGKVKTLGGAVNTSECVGYTMEMFIPNTTLGLKESPSFIFANPTLIRSLSDSPSEQRLWYNVAMEQRDGGFANPSTWFQFDKDGLICHELDVQSSAGGKVETMDRISGILYDYALTGDNVAVIPKPEAGKYCSRLTVNGVDVTSELMYTENLTYYYLADVSQDVEILAEFSDLSTATRTMTGQLSAEPALPNGNFELASVYAVKNGYRQQISVQSDGGFTVQLPDTEMYIIAYAQDRALVRIAVGKGDTDVEVPTLKASALGNNEQVGFIKYNPLLWDTGTFASDGTIRSLSSGATLEIANTEIFDDSIFASTQILMPCGDNDDRRAGFTFYTADGYSVYVALTGHRVKENGIRNYSIQVVLYHADGGTRWFRTQSFEDVGVIDHLASGVGVPFAVRYVGGKLTVWVNGEARLTDLVCLFDNEDLFLSSGTVKNAAIGLQTWMYGATFKYVVFASGEDAVGYPSSGIAPVVVCDDNGTVSTDHEVYAIGDTVTFTLAPKDDYQIDRVMLNGKNVSTSVRSGKLILTDYRLPVLTLEVSYNIEQSCNVELNLFLHKYSIDDDNRIAADDDTMVTFAGPVREYRLPVIGGKILIEGIPYGEYSVALEDNEEYYSYVLTVDGTAKVDITFEYKFFEETPYADLSAMNDGVVTVLENGVNIGMTEKVAANEDFLITALVKSDTLHPDKDISLGLAAWNDLNADGYYEDGGGSLPAEFLYGRLVWQVNEWTPNGAWILQVYSHDWKNLDITANTAALNKLAGEGLRIGLGRIDGIFYIFFDNGGEGLKHAVTFRKESTAQLSNVALTVGLRTENEPRTFKDITLTRNKAEIATMIEGAFVDWAAGGATIDTSQFQSGTLELTGGGQANYLYTPQLSGTQYYLSGNMRALELGADWSTGFELLLTESQGINFLFQNINGAIGQKMFQCRGGNGADQAMTNDVLQAIWGDNGLDIILYRNGNEFKLYGRLTEWIELYSFTASNVGKPFMQFVQAGGSVRYTGLQFVNGAPQLNG